MKGLIAKTLCGAGLLTGAVGCVTCSDLYDPCYPQRYNSAARQEVVAAFAPQMHNGHILDQTVWNHDFEAGSDKLTPGGMEKLGQLARRRPIPDPTVYIQTAQDINYDPAAPDKYVKERMDLDKKRADAVDQYLRAYSAGRPGVSFVVFVHNPSEVGLAAQPVGISVNKMYSTSLGNLPLNAANVQGGAGAAPAGGAR